MTDETSVTTQGLPRSDRDGLPVPIEAVPGSLPIPSEPVESIQDSKQPSSGSAPSARQNGKEHVEFSSFVHEYIRDCIKLADQKASFFFTGSTALLAFLYTKNISARWLKPVMSWNIMDMLAFVAMVGLAIGASFALLVVFPRTRGSRRGFVFWEAVAEHGTGREYADELWRLYPPSLFRELSEHSFDLAVVCRQKYNMLRWAVGTCGVGLVASLVVLLLL